jgi:hypothetical protein
VTRKRILQAVLAALFVAAAIAVLNPQWFAWNRYRGAIASVAANRLGRSVSIAGPVTLALWPAPELTAEQVDVGGDGHGGNGFHVASLRLRVALGSLLAGRVEASELALRGLDLRLPWPLPQAVLASRPPHWLGAFAANVEGGTLHLGELTVAKIDATITQGEDGMLAAAGTAHLNAQVGHFTVRLGAPGGDGTAALDVSLDGLDKLDGSGASFSGSVAADGSLDGHVVAHGADLALLIGAPSLTFRANGRLTIGDGLAALDEATFDLAGAPASGALALRWLPVARLDAAVSATRLDLDPWLAALFPPKQRGVVQAPLPIGVDLSVEAARLGGGTVQHLRARADVEGGTVRLTGVAAVLPGEAKLELDGVVEAGADQAPLLTGAMRLDAPALRTTLRWLTESGLAKLPEPPAAVLGNAAFTAKLRADPDSFALDGLTGRVDGAAVAGSVRLDGGLHPGFKVDVATDMLALDPWLPPASLRLAPIRGETAQVAVRAEHATLRGLPIDGLMLDAAAAADGRLTLHQLEGTTRGLRLSAAGTLGADGRLADAKLTLSGPSAQPLADLAPAGFATPALWQQPMALAVQGGGPPSALALGIALDLGDARLEAQPVIDLTNGTWRASASLRHPGAERLLRLLGVLVPSDAVFARDWPGEGSLSLTGQFSHAPGSDLWGKLAADNFELTAGLLRAGGQLALDGRQVNGSIVADVLPLPFPDATSQTPLPLSILHGWRGTVHVQAEQIAAGPIGLLDHTTMTVNLAGNVLSVDNLVGQADGGTLSGSAALNIADSPPVLTASGTLRDAIIQGAATEATVGLLSGHLDATATLAAHGYSPAALLATLSGTLHATAHDGALAGFDLFGAGRAIGAADGQVPTVTEQALRTALEGGTTSFDTLDLTGEAAHGLLSLTDARLQATAGRAVAQGSIGLTDGTMDVQVALTPSVPGAPGVGLRLDGLLTAPAHQPELAAASRWLAERPATR